MMKRNFFQRLILPGLIFQSAMIGGGYATGRELVEFFLRLGPMAGLVAMGVATVVIGLVCAVAFEFARAFSLYDYRVFFRKLLGPGWILFEVAYISLILLILSVLGAAAGELTSNAFGVQPVWGSIVMMVAVGSLVFWGSLAIERFLSVWSILLYLAYGVLIVWSLITFGGEIESNLLTHDQPTTDLDSLWNGWTFAGYNVVVFTSVLFVVRHFTCRRDALWAGALCGPLGMIPGLLLLIAMIAHYPQVIDESLPISYLLDKLQAPAFMALFQVVIFGTFIETGTAMLHSVNERISEVYRERAMEMPRILRPFVAATLLVIAIYLAEAVGIVSLIGEGYAYSTYLFLVIVVLPLLTRGLVMICNQGKVLEVDMKPQESSL
jgi:uncharacterized membrane protein YkvI